MDISENDIEWTTGTDKPYGQTVFEQWQDKLGKNPTDKDLRLLRNQKKALESRLKKLNTELEQVHNDTYSGEASAMNLMELIELREDAAERIGELLAEFDSVDKNMKNPRELAISISSKDSSRWSEDVIYAYLAAYANNENLSAEKVRTKAINNANKKTVKTDLAKVDKSVLYTWINKLR